MFSHEPVSQRIAILFKTPFTDMSISTDTVITGTGSERTITGLSLNMDNALANKNILIVEDAMTIRHLLKTVLRSNGFHNTIESEAGEKALKVLNKDEIGLVISDWEMPNMNGLELFENIMNDIKLNNIPFILLTSFGDKDKVKLALSKGIKNYIVKPFTPEIVINKVTQILQQ